MSWLKDHFGTDKPIIALLHVRALPGDPLYKKDAGSMHEIIRIARKELNDLQNGGVDGILFSNEFSLPYSRDVDAVTVGYMSRIVGELIGEIRIPYGCNIIKDPYKALDFAKAVEGSFIRGFMTGACAGTMGIIDMRMGKIVRRKLQLDMDDLKIFCALTPEGAEYIAPREMTEIAKSVIFRCEPDALCVSGDSAGTETDTNLLKTVRDVTGDVPVMCNTGCRLSNVDKTFEVCDGAFVGTTFKKDGKFKETVDAARVIEFMNKAKALRKGM